MLRSEVVEMLILNIDKHMHDVSTYSFFEEFLINPDIEEWLEFHVGDLWDVYALDEDTHQVRDDTPEEDDRAFAMWGIFFGKAEDAFAFKMRWC